MTDVCGYEDNFKCLRRHGVGFGEGVCVVCFFSEEVVYVGGKGVGFEVVKKGCGIFERCRDVGKDEIREEMNLKGWGGVLWN